MSRRFLLAAVVALAALPAAPAGAQSGPVLVVGDSLEVGTGPPLRRQLAPLPVTVDARTGRPSPEGVRVLRERIRPDHRVVVFDLGTNDDPAQDEAFARTLKTVRSIVGERCLVVSTLARPPVSGVSVGGMNRTVRSFFESDPNARLADWEAAVRVNPRLLAADNVHATPTGYAARARLVAGAIEECFGGDEDAPEPPDREDPEPEPPADEERPGQSTAGGRSWSDVLALTPYALVRGWATHIAETVMVAAKDVGGTFGPQPPEVELGAPKGAR